jgi:hypothetical protein
MFFLTINCKTKFAFICPKSKELKNTWLLNTKKLETKTHEQLILSFNIDIFLESV